MKLLEIDIVLKGVQKRDGGEFLNDKNQKIEYEPSYVIKFDETVDGEILERRLKFPLSNKTLYNKLSNLDPYSKVILLCDVKLYTANAKVIPVDIK